VSDEAAARCAQQFGTRGAFGDIAFRYSRICGQSGLYDHSEMELKPLVQKALADSSPENVGMTVKQTNRSHRVLTMVVLLVFAVALTTALVLAGERKPEGSKSSTLQRDTVPTLRASVWGTSHA
jgi:hypothetical protein